jgi:hypothetical protein
MEAFPIFSGAESQVRVRAFSVAPGPGNFYEFSPDCRPLRLQSVAAPAF